MVQNIKFLMIYILWQLLPSPETREKELPYDDDWVVQKSRNVELQSEIRKLIRIDF